MQDPVDSEKQPILNNPDAQPDPVEPEKLPVVKIPEAIPGPALSESKQALPLASVNELAGAGTQKVANPDEIENNNAQEAQKLLREAKRTFKTIPQQFKQSLFELTGDLDRKEFSELVKPYLAIKTKGSRLIDLRDANKRSLLCQAAFRGNYEVVQYLLAFYKALNTSPYSEDINGNNALELACIRGYNNSPTECHTHSTGQQTNISKRYFVIRLLLNFKISITAVKKKILASTLKDDEFHPFSVSQENQKNRGVYNRGNVPLHWSVYWNDADLTYLMFEKNPFFAFAMNDNNQIPFDIPLANSNEFEDTKKSFVSRIIKTLF